MVFPQSVSCLAGRGRVLSQAFKELNSESISNYAVNAAELVDYPRNNWKYTLEALSIALGATSGPKAD